jgi:hypothetical protein
MPRPSSQSGDRRGRDGEPSVNNDLASAVSAFGSTVTSKLNSNEGSPEDHLRAAFETLLLKVGKFLGVRIKPIGETRLPELGIRPDYAVEVEGARTGYVEIKAPGRGVPGNGWTPKGRERVQWDQLCLLPNVLYTDGEKWALFRFGESVGEVATLTPGLRTAGSRLRATDNLFEMLLRDFLTWAPERPRTIGQLIRATANLCRLLRHEVHEIMVRESTGAIRPSRFTRLAHEWRGLLFPNLTDPQFADAYAQTVTFALLLARVEGIDFTNRSVGEIAILLGKNHSLMGKALSVLVNDAIQKKSVAIDTLLRIIGVVHWEDFTRDTYIHLFEHFLNFYDPEQRKRSGSYYTPDQVATFMVRFADDILRTRLRLARGFAANDVIVVDPAMGTGSFLARIIDRVADTIHECEGPGQVAPRLRSLSRRLVGFEKQAAAYAVCAVAHSKPSEERLRCRGP